MSKEDQCLCELDETQKAKEAQAKKTKDEKVKDLMKKSIYDKKVEIPEDVTEDKVRAPVAKCSNIQPFKLEDMVTMTFGASHLNNGSPMDIEKVLVEYRVKKPKTETVPKNDTRKVEKEKKDVSKMSDCEAFRLAGFQHDWTKEKIEGLLKSDDGRALLERVDREFKRLTGKKTISESDILKCYPNYLKKSKNIQLSIKIDD